ncbi:MAG: DUF1499 domain-containing protein [Planctomycetota bacterium]
MVQRKKMQWFGFAILLLVIGFFGARYGIKAMSSAPSLGVQEGKFTPLPNRPNCVSSQTEVSEKKVEPLSFQGPIANARQKLLQCIQQIPTATILLQKENYIRVETRSSLLGFIDDTEFYLEEGKIQIRASSRLGYSDFGVNRKRVDTIRNLFESK